MSHLKIAFDGKRFFRNSSGLGNYSRDLVRILATFFPEEQLFILDKNPTEKGKEILELPNVHFLKTTSGNLSRQMKMGKDAQNIDADIFHGLSGELPLKWSGKKIKKVVTVHDLIFLRFPEYYQFFDRKIHLWKFRKAVQNADLIIAISEQTKRDLIKYLHVPDRKIRVVYQGCHPSFKTEKTEEFLQKVKEKFNLSERFILNVGTIESRKNLFNIVKAIHQTDIPLVVVGRKTKYFNKVEGFLLKNKMSHQVSFLENVSMEELSAIYQLSDFLVYPSFFEGFGIPVIEALFSKTAVITSNTSSLPEAGGENTMYVTPDNLEDLRAKIQFLWNNEAERKRRVTKGFEYVQKFNDQEIANRLMSVYHEVLEK